MFVTLICWAVVAILFAVAVIVGAVAVSLVKIVTTDLLP